MVGENRKIYLLLYMLLCMVKYSSYYFVNIFGKHYTAIMGSLILLSEDGFRCDGRRPTELRQLSCKMGVYKQADGSAYIEQGETKVLATVYGPHEVWWCCWNADNTNSADMRIWSICSALGQTSNECGTLLEISDRLYSVHFQISNRRLFLWMGHNPFPRLLPH